MSHTLTLTHPVFDAEAKPSRAVAARKLVVAVAPATVGKERLLPDSLVEHVSTAAYCSFFLALVTWTTLFVATLL
jgi:hypothetical protein